MDNISGKFTREDWDKAVKAYTSPGGFQFTTECAVAQFVRRVTGVSGEDLSTGMAEVTIRGEGTFMQDAATKLIMHAFDNVLTTASTADNDSLFPGELNIHLTKVPLPPYDENDDARR